MANLTLVTSLTKAGLALTALAIGVVMSGSASAATVLLEDNFDSENGGVRQLNYDNFANWNVTDGTVDIVTKDQFFPGGEGIIVDLDGTSDDAGKLESKTTFTFNRGDLVDLSFKLAGDQRNFGSPTNSAIVSLGDLFNATYTLEPFQGFVTQTISFSVISPTTANLSFEGIGGDNVGLLLDDVKLTVTPAPVPEPLTILGSLTAGAFGVALRKKSQQQGKAKGTV